MHFFSKHNINLDKIAKALNFILLLAILFFGITMVLIGAYYAYPNAEDLSVSVKARKEHGFLISIIETLLYYDGRYFTNILHAVNPLVFNSISGYKWTIPGMFFSLIFSVFFFLKTIGLKVYKSIFFSFLSVIVIISLVPSLPHFLYWMISGFVYLVPWTFLFLTLAFGIKYYKEQNKVSKNLWLVLTTIALFCGIGINEMFLPVYFLLIVLGGYYTFKSKILLDFFPIFIIGIASLILFTTSPGISHRLYSFTESRDLSYYMFVFQTGSKHTLFSFYKWFFQNLIFIPFLLVVFLNTPKRIFLKFKKLPNSLLAIIPVILFSMLIPYYYAMGVYTFYPKRIFSGWMPGFLILVFFSFFFLLSKSTYLLRRLEIIKTNKILTSILLVIMLSGIIFTNNNINLIFKEYRTGVLQNYQNQLEIRYETIHQAFHASEKFKIVIVEPLNKPPKSIYHGPDIKPNRSPIWWNIAYEDYFYLDEIKLKSDTTPLFIESHYEFFLNN